MGGDLILDEEAQVQPKHEKVQREVGEQKNICQESEGKQQAEDSKTCLYFHPLDTLYREKSKEESVAMTVKPESTVAPLMVRLEQLQHQQNRVVKEGGGGRS